MVKLYKLASEQLSQQDHYDFGMRAVKSVLVMAGSLRRAQPDLAEDVVLIRAMRDTNLPKFLPDDIELFQNIISDLFPGIEVPYQVGCSACQDTCHCCKCFGPEMHVVKLSVVVVIEAELGSMLQVARPSCVCLPVRHFTDHCNVCFTYCAHQCLLEYSILKVAVSTLCVLPSHSPSCQLAQASQQHPDQTMNC